MGQVLLGGRGGARLKYNLFVQPDEPLIKDGLWIKTPAAVPVSDIIVKGSYMRAGHFAAANDCEFASHSYKCSNITNALRCVWATECINGCLYCALFEMITNMAPTAATVTYGSIDKINIFTGTVSEIYNGKFKGIYDYFYYTEGRFICGVNGTFDCATEKMISSNYRYNDYFGTPLGRYKGNDYYVYGTEHGHTLEYSSPEGNSGGLGSYPVSVEPFKIPNLFYEDKLYGFGDSKVAIADLITKTIRYGTTNPIPATGAGPYGCVLYGDKFLMSAEICSSPNYGAMYMYDTVTDTYTLLDTIKAPVVGQLCIIPGHGVLCDIAAAQNVAQFVLDSQSEPIDTLCLQEGEEHRINILSANSVQTGLPKKARSILNSSQYQPAKLSLSDAWYYDTDFREYPTFIGTGTAWTKIKN